MFRKNKKNNSFLDEEVIVATSKSKKNDNKIKREEKKVIQDIAIVKSKVVDSRDYNIGNFTFYDNDPQNECSVDEIEIEEIDIHERSISKRKDLSVFFEESKEYNRKMQEKKTKEKKNPDILKNIEIERSSSNEDDVYVFRNIEYSKVEDFIEYLDSNYLDIENISKEALKDEKYYEWLSKKSKVFDKSLKQFKEIKEKIEKK